MESTAERTERRPIRVSVVVVSQQQVELLRATLTALARREKPEESEIIVVDCGSQDGSARLDDEFESITLLRLQRNFGWTKAVNIATRTSKGEYLLLLPNGVEVAPDTIGRLLAGIESDPEVGAVCPAGDCYALPQAGERELRAVGAAEAEYPFDQPVLLPRIAIVSMNYLPDAYGQFYGDLDLFYKMRGAGKRILVLADLVLSRSRAPQTLIDEEMAEADQISGLASFYSKNYGFGAWLRFLLGQSLRALFGFRLGLMGKLLSGAKVDGL
ncbi:MAG: glycosyltransferase [Acidobacteriota bacterium]|jgi:glycosyltransferase involved in cell wall biosynthesis